jgi:adenylylsulfate kinase
MEENLVPFKFNITKEGRNKLNKHKSFLVWFTGLSGSGKSTIANLLETKLHALGVRTYILDGDIVRKSVNQDLNFTPEDRKENIRRIAEIAGFMVDAGLVVLATFISPYKKDRESVEIKIKPNNFVEVFVNTTLKECKSRDVKGLYKKASDGSIDNLTGVSSPYENPENPDVEITDDLSSEEAAEKILKKIYNKLELKKE